MGLRSLACGGAVLGVMLVLGGCGGDDDDSAGAGSGAAGGAAASTSGTGGAGGSAGMAGSNAAGAGGMLAAGSGGAAGSVSPMPTCPTPDSEAAALAENGVKLLLDTGIFGVPVVGVADGNVYFSQDNQLQRLSVDGGQPEAVAPLMVRPRLLGADLLYWADDEGADGSNRILTAPLSDPSMSTVVAEGIDSLDTLTYDHDNFYFSTHGMTPAIYRVPIAGGEPELLVDGGQPLGSVVHDGYYYWLDFHTDSLERVAVTGGTRERLTEVHFGGPMAAEGDTVYWGDTSLKTVEKWNASEGRVRLSGADPDDVVVADGVVYWTDGFINGRVRSVKSDGSDAKEYVCGLSSPGGIYVTDGAIIAEADNGIFRIER